jgi:23S rRNA (cytosine1962-C5)-methyltransferase
MRARFTPARGSTYTRPGKNALAQNAVDCGHGRTRARSQPHDENVRGDDIANMSAATPGRLRHGIAPVAREALRNRLTKNWRHWSRWARRHDYGAFRCYDRDIPEFPLYVDCYVPGDAPDAPRLHVQEVETGWVQDAHAHAQWQREVMATVAEATAIPPGRIAWKQRPRRSGGAQHEKTGREGEPFVVIEAGLSFLVNLDAYLDTGLFLDHRALRARVRSRAAGRSMLNLFAYTGSFTVHAAAGGATRSDTVDLSQTYLAWAARNFDANGMDRTRHALIRADVTRWLGDARAEGRRYDLIVLDPPAFSNSKAMRDDFDVQRDHVALVHAARALLAPGGELYFSTNLRTFVLDASLARDPACTDITAQTRAEDFRDPRVHCAWLIEAS